MSEVLVDRVPFDGEGSKLVITLNRPERVNAFTEEMFTRLNAALDEAERDDDIRVVMIGGNGEKGFCSGLDRNDLARLTEGGRQKLIYGWIYGTAKRIDAFPKPVIAKVHGHCIAAGAHLAFASDLIIAGESARFFEPGVRGTGFDDEEWGKRYGRILGPVRAMRYLLTVEPLTGREAYEIGLASMVVPDDQLDGTADRIAATLGSCTPAVVRRMMELISRGAGGA
jgi:enoyl-CoA hydratase/carnithine racemase